MKKEIRIALIILVGFLSLLWLEKPFREYLSDAVFEEQIARHVSSISVRICLIVAAIFVIRQLKQIDFTGLNNWRRIKNIHAVFIALAFIIMGIFGNWSIYANTHVDLLALFALSTLAVGIVEELVFRGVVFPLLIKSFRDKGRPILVSAVVSSLAFGLIHFFNLFSQPDNVLGITSQVFFATSIGVFFSGLMVRTENILIPCLIHALVNFSFGAGELNQVIEEVSASDEITGIDWSSVIPTSIFFTFILVGGIYMILKADKEVILSRLKSEDEV